MSKLQVVEKDGKYYAKRYSKVLYENANGNNDTFTLNDSISNYKYLEFYYRTNDGYIGSKKIVASGKPISIVDYAPQESRLIVKTAVYQISDKSVVFLKADNKSIIYEYGIRPLSEGSVPFINNINQIYVTKVIGYND